MLHRLKHIASNYPKLAAAGASVLRRYHALRSEWMDYGHPGDNSAATVDLATVKAFNKHRHFGPRKKICYAPFNNMHFGVDGKVAACSFNNDYYIGDIQTHSLREIWFGDKAESFRRELENYSFKNCMNCQYILESGNYSAFPPLKYDLYASNETRYPTQMSFETSNICNLECVMCSGEFSSLIRKNRDGLPPLRYRYPTDFRDQLREFIPHLKIATFVGGEPLLIKEYYDLWEEIIRLNPACSIHIQTNATVLPDRFKDMLETGRFDIGVSIDAVSKPLYEAIRVNADFDSVQGHIDYLVGLHRKGKTYLNFNFCPLTLNWREIPGMVEYANSRQVSLKLLNVDHPYHLALRYRGPDYLSTVHDYLVSHEPENNGRDFIRQNNVRSYRQLVTQVAAMIPLAETREEQMREAVRHEPDTLLALLRSEFMDNPMFRKLNHDERGRLAGQCCDYLVNARRDSGRDRRNTVARFLVHLRAVEGEKTSQRSLEEMFHAFRKVADGMIMLEQEIRELAPG